MTIQNESGDVELENNVSNGTYAIVTPSFGGDFERCELLTESIKNCGPGWIHYIIVDKHDIPKFRTLADSKTIIMDSREILDSRLIKTPGRSGIWLSFKTPPVRGWMTQQIRKLGIHQIIDQDNFLCCDSDTVFLKRFSKGNFLVNEKLGLLDVDFRDKYVDIWTKKAEQLFGMKPHSVMPRGHVGMMIMWNRRILAQLQNVIEGHCNVNWQIAVARNATFSEYITYGVFVRSMIGYENSPHNPSDVDLVKTNWGKTLNSKQDFADFFQTLLDTQIAAMVHSKDGISVKTYREAVELHWKHNV
jgi:Family of unknown function (DUF6492)